MALVLALTLFPTFAYNANAAEVNSARIAERDYEIGMLSDCEYESGSAIVTVAASENSALTKPGTCAFDSHITVESVHDFGDEYVVYLTSDKYSTEQLIKKAYDIYYVTNATANKIVRLESTNDSGALLQTHLKEINIDSVPEVSSLDDVVVAVIDSGVDYTHEDLQGSIWVNPLGEKLEGTYGYDTGDSDSDPMDTNGHGTHVAGIIAAQSDNDLGVRGISSAKIMALKATTGSEDYMYQEAIIDALRYVYDALELGVNIKVVNCSWGGAFESGEVIFDLVEKIGKAGAVFVFAAGNGINGVGRDLDKVTEKYIPIDLEKDYVITVGSADNGGTRSDFSDYGKETVDLFAPGSNIYSTYLDNPNEELFTPWTYSAKERKKKCLYLSTIEESDLNILTPGEDSLIPLTSAEIGLPSDYIVKKTIVNEGSNKYIRLEATLSPENYDPNATDGREHIGSIYLDVTDLNLDEDALYYVSWCENGLDYDMNWNTVTYYSSAESSRFTHLNGKTYFRVCGLSASEFGTFTAQIDNLAISKADITIKDHSNYDYLSGTSMSAPVVSGAVALVAQMAPDLDAKELKAAVLGSVKQVDTLLNLCSTGGVLDLSKLPVYAKSLSLNKSSVTLKYGKTVSLKATLKPSNILNTKVTWTVSNSKYARVTKNGTVKAKAAGIGHKVKVVATAANGKKDYCIVKIKG